jgi:hypothetical protein
MIIANAADPGVSTRAAGGTAATSPRPRSPPDYVAAHIADSSPWDTGRPGPQGEAGQHQLLELPPPAVDRRHRQRRRAAGVTATAARYAGLGFIYEGRTSRTAPRSTPVTPSSPSVGRVRPRRVGGDSTARVALPCPVTFSRATDSGLTAYCKPCAPSSRPESGEDRHVVPRLQRPGSTTSSPSTRCGRRGSRSSSPSGSVAPRGSSPSTTGWRPGTTGPVTWGTSSRYSSLNMYAQVHVERERLFLFYMRQHGQDDFVMWHINTPGMPSRWWRG